LDGLIFDFDGVVADSEPIHLRCFQRVLADLGIALPADVYYRKYLGYDDRQCFGDILKDHRQPAGEDQVGRLVAAKTALVKAALAADAQPMPGVRELAESARRAGVPLAICSSAWRDEIELGAHRAGLLDQLALIVAAEDVPRGKPDPMGYELTLRRLRQATGRAIRPGRCLAVEDSPFGVTAAAAAGMKTLAIAGSYGAADLKAASRVVGSLADVTLDELEEILD
jgi:beta-phosphoglucomutase